MNINVAHRISVIIPAYNRENTIKYCLNSVLKQSLSPYEVIVVDDCSSDNTVEIVKQFNDERVRCICLGQRSGAQAARNIGIKEAKGDWIAFQDSDDEWLENKLKCQIDLAIGGGFNVVHCGCYVQKGGIRSMFQMPNLSGSIFKKLLRTPGPTFPGLLVKKECLFEIGCLDENVPSYQEWDTVIRLAKAHSIGYIHEPLFVYHIHDGETISKNFRKDVEGWVYIVSKFKNEIINELGYVALINHYWIIIEKYCNLNDYRQVAIYKSYISQIPRAYRIIYFLYNLLRKTKATIRKIL